jgi:hypothetical protein
MQKGKSRTAVYYQENDAARRKNIENNKRHGKKPIRKAYRRLLERINYSKGTSGNHDGIDNSHIDRKRTRKQKQEDNRGDKRRQFFSSKLNSATLIKALDAQHRKNKK